MKLIVNGRPAPRPAPVNPTLFWASWIHPLGLFVLIYLCGALNGGLAFAMLWWLSTLVVIPSQMARIAMQDAVLVGVAMGCAGAYLHRWIEGRERERNSN